MAWPNLGVVEATPTELTFGVNPGQMFFHYRITPDTPPGGFDTIQLIGGPALMGGRVAIVNNSGSNIVNIQTPASGNLYLSFAREPVPEPHSWLLTLTGFGAIAL